MVESGDYPSTEAVIHRALCLLEEDHAEYVRQLAKVRAMLKESEEAVERGEYRVYTDENLHELFDEIKRGGRKRSIKRLERRLAKAKSGHGSD